MRPPRTLYSTSEIAHYCGVSASTLARWKAAGVLPRGYESPRAGWLLDERELETAILYANEHRRGPGRPRLTTQGDLR